VASVEAADMMVGGFVEYFRSAEEYKANVQERYNVFRQRLIGEIKECIGVLGNDVMTELTVLSNPSTEESSKVQKAIIRESYEKCSEDLQNAADHEIYVRFYDGLFERKREVLREVADEIADKANKRMSDLLDLSIQTGSPVLNSMRGFGVWAATNIGVDVNKLFDEGIHSFSVKFMTKAREELDFVFSDYVSTLQKRIVAKAGEFVPPSVSGTRPGCGDFGFDDSGNVMPPSRVGDNMFYFDLDPL
jgi:hypothetical protein